MLEISDSPMQEGDTILDPQVSGKDTTNVEFSSNINTSIMVTYPSQTRCGKSNRIRK